MLGRVRRAALLVAMLVGLAGAATAAADTVTIPPGTGLPWTDPAHHSLLEQLATQVAQTIAGRPNVSVRCEGLTDWDTLAAQHRFDPSVELGYVDLPPVYRATLRFAADAEMVQLSPAVCWNLQQFAEASTKPTKCQPIVLSTAPERVPVHRRVHGHLVTRYVWRNVTRQTVGPFAPCWGTAGVIEPGSYWTAYSGYAHALWTLAHESIHLTQLRDGAYAPGVMPSSETDANCFGLQWLPTVARMLGDTPDDAERIAQFAYAKLYPGYQGVFNNGSPYWSADCRPGGPLDLTPSDGVWP